MLENLQELDTSTEDSSALRGAITITAPTMFGRMHVLPLLQSFLVSHPGVAVRFLLLDRVVSLVDEGIDLAIRIGNLPDSSLRAKWVGTVQESVFASPGYLAAHGTPQSPRELLQHSIIACSTVTPVADRWSFASVGPVAVRPRLVVNTTEAAVDAAVAGLGITMIVSYQAAPHVALGRLVRLLAQYEVTP